MKSGKFKKTLNAMIDKDSSELVAKVAAMKIDEKDV